MITQDNAPFHARMQNMASVLSILEELEREARANGDLEVRAVTEKTRSRLSMNATLCAVTTSPTPPAQRRDAYGGRSDAGTPQAEPSALLRSDGNRGASDRYRHRRYTDTREINELPHNARGTDWSKDVELIEIWLAMSPFLSVTVGKFLRGMKAGVA